MTSKATAVSSAPVKLRRFPDGRIEALSSDGESIYRVVLSIHTQCSCPAGLYGKIVCKHVKAALARYGELCVVPIAGVVP